METILKLIYGKTSHNECYSTNTKPIKFNYLSNHIYIYMYMVLLRTQSIVLGDF